MPIHICPAVSFTLGWIGDVPAIISITWRDRESGARAAKESDKENIRRQAAAPGSSVKQSHIKNYEVLTKDVESPVLNKAENQFSGLLQTILSPEYRKAELDFEKIAEANISSENLLYDINKSLDNTIPGISVLDEPS